MNPSCSALVFDFFGVICAEVAPNWLARFFEPRESAAVKDKIVGAADRGVISVTEMYESLSEMTGVPQHIIAQEWHEAAAVDRDMVDLVAAQRGAFKVGLLTNAPAGFFWPICHRYALEPLFDAIVVSSDEGCAKPDVRPYQTVMTRLGVNPTHALMIDDNPLNVAAARELGMSGVVFTGAAQLRELLNGLRQ